MGGIVRLKFLGIFKKAFGSEDLSLQVEKEEKLSDILKRIGQISPSLERVLIDPVLKDPRPNAVILVNGKEISILKGLETEINEGDELIFIPVTHGG